MTSVIGQFSMSQISNLFRIAYGDLEEDAMGWDHSEFIANIEKRDDFVGNRLEVSQVVDVGGGSSSGSLPSSSSAKVIKPFITAKPVYATSVIDRQSLLAARKSGPNIGAFKDLTTFSIQTMRSSFRDSIARQFMGDGTGALGTISAITVNAAGDYSCTITAGTWIEANWIENDLLNVDIGSSLFLVSDINLTTRVIRIVRQTGADVPAVGQILYKQKSKDQEMLGLKGIIDTSSGTLYGTTVGYRWGAKTVDGAGQAPSVKLMRQLDQQMRMWSRGSLPTHYIMSLTQLRLFEDGEDAKSIIYVEPQTSPERESGSQVASVKINGRTIRLLWSPFCQEDRIYAINKNKIHLYLRPETMEGAEPGGFIENGDGNIFHPLMTAGTPLDSYQMFYATYGNFYINPTFTGAITGLATS